VSSIRRGKRTGGAPTGSVAANVSWASFGLLRATAADIERTSLEMWAWRNGLSTGAR
jgi:hypothetical protein